MSDEPELDNGLGDPYCPKCEPLQIRRRSDGKMRIQRTVLRLVENNPHGYDYDLFECPQCQKMFEVYYRVSSIEERRYKT